MNEVFHADGEEREGEEDKNTDMYCKIAEESNVEWEKDLARNLNEADENRTYNNGWKELESILRQHLETVRVRYSRGRQLFSRASAQPL